MNERDDVRDRPYDFASDEPLPLGATEPVDVVAVRADDAFIAALGATTDTHVDDPIDERLAELLRSWREDVYAEPEPPLVDVDAVPAAASAATVRPGRRYASPLGPLATAAAVLVIAFAGLGLAAKDATPGDPLWNVTKVLYSDRAKSVEAAVTVRTKLDQANKALETGNIAAAVVALEEAKAQLPAVQAEDGKDQLVTQAQQLMAEVAGTPTPAPPVPTSEPPVAVTTTVDPTTEPSPEPVSTTEPASQPATSAVQPSATPNPEPPSDVSPSTLPGDPTPGGSAKSGTQEEPAGSPSATN